MLTFNKRDWDGLRSCTTADLVYDEVAAPHRRVEGIDQVIAMWQEATIAFPDIW